MTTHPPTSRQPARRRAKAAVVLLAVGASSLAAVGPLASPALAASPQVTITCTAPSHCTATGTGFTPSGQVAELAATGSGTFSSSYLTASAPTPVCVTGVKPACRLIGGGAFTAPLPVDYGLACDATAAGTVSYTDVKSHAVVTKHVTYVGPCPQPTTTTLSVPSTIDTRWTSPFPATVSAGSTFVFSGTITITVNGSTFCSYTLGTGSGCTGANLPAGTDQIQATYSGSAEPRYDPSSASATVTVLPVHSPVAAKSGNWAGYVAVGDTFTSVSATWTVPAANCSFGTVSYSSTWVGLDGFADNPVEQIGTDSNCAFFGLGEYHAWWEVYPGGPTLIGDLGLTDDDPVYPGDVMSASVTATSTPGTFVLTIEDRSQVWSYTTTQSDPGATGTSAEWIEEQPSGGVQLTNFGSVTFSQCMVTGSEGGGIALPIWDHPNSALTMADGSTTKATASPLSDDGTQFTVTFLHS
jgi:Peptidase A4 family